MNIFMQHWYWTNNQHCLISFFLNLKWLKPLSIFLKKICALHIQWTNYFKITLFTYKIPPLHNEQLKKCKGAKNTNYSVSVQSWKQMKRNVNNLLMCFFFKKQVFIKHYLRVTKSWIILLHWYSTCFIRTKLTIKKPITKSIHICVTKTVCRICQSYLVWIITL